MPSAGHGRAQEINHHYLGQPPTLPPVWEWSVEFITADRAMAGQLNLAGRPGTVTTLSPDFD